MKNVLRFLNTQPTWLMVLVSFLVLLVGWHLLVVWGAYDRFILPGPADVWRQMVIVVGDGRLLKHSLITISEVLPGLAIGLLVAMPLGLSAGQITLGRTAHFALPHRFPGHSRHRHCPAVDHLGAFHLLGRVLVAVLVVFFPILINIIAGLRSVPAELYELMHSLQATRRQIFSKLEFPAALPILLAGLKVGATLSVIGALVGEFVQPKSEGLGYLLVTARYQFKTDLVFVVLVTLAAIALSLYGLVSLLEKRLLRWQKSMKNNQQIGAG